MLLILALGLIGGVYPQVGWAQDSTQVVAEGQILNRTLNRIYSYRLDSDSTVHIRQVQPSTDTPAFTLPAQTLESIYERAQEQLFPSETREYLRIGYEDQVLVLGFSQRFDLYVLATLIVVVLVGGSVLAWLWWRLAREQRRRRTLARSRRYLTEGREKERERLAQEIHDGPVQDLHGLHMQIKALSSADTDRLQTMGDELMRVTRELRAMSADLHPPALQRFGLAAALRSHADRLQDRHSPLEVNIDVRTDELSIPEDYALPLFRIAQEAMNNAAQHGEAPHIRVQVQEEDGVLDLEIRDDGDGFTLPDDWHALAAEDHYGLLGMRERAEAIGADLHLESAPEEGTRVHLRCALEAEASTSHSSASTLL
jgi:signal transduction histidine kinase